MEPFYCSITWTLPQVLSHAVARTHHCAIRTDALFVFPIIEPRDKSTRLRKWSMIHLNEVLLVYRMRILPRRLSALHLEGRLILQETGWGWGEASKHI